MASWLKVAEGLLEVVDRRAKQVATELSEEQSDSQSSASNGQESQAGRTKSKEKDHWRPSTARSPPVNDAEQEQTIIHASPSNAITTNDNDHSSDISVAMPSNLTTQADTETESDANKATRNSSIPLADPAVNDISKLDVDVKVEMSATENNIEVGNPLLNGENDVENTSSGHERSSSAPLDATGVHSMHQHHPPPEELDSKVESVDENALKTTNIEKFDNEIVGSHGNNNIQEKELEILQESLPKKQQEQKSDTPPKKVQDQLDEAQGLLTSTVSTGQSKEARLARVCAGLSSRLQEYKSENAQLEELLVAEREQCNTYEARIKQLQQELSTSKSGLGKVESSMADALAAKNSEIESLRTSMDELKKQAAISEGQLASLQANMETVMRSRELTETRMMQALREEVASVERRAEEEHAAHSATKMSAMEREVELEHRAVEASTALARIQRTADERASRAAELEQKLALLEAECASLNQELQEMEARVRRSEKRSPEEANQALKIQAWQEEVERARQGQRDAESKFSTMEAELQKMRVEMAGMKRDAEHYSRQEHMELEKRYRELTDLLYYKQTQLEAMASEKAAAEFQLEKEASRLQEAQIEAERSRVARRPSSSWEEDSDFKALEPLPMHHRHMVGASIQLQKAVKLIDSGAVSATRFLWRYPIARVILLFYLVFVHLFLMFLLHRLQEQADNFAAKEVAASMGLGTSNLP